MKRQEINSEKSTAGPVLHSEINRDILIDIFAWNGYD
jgi:hypothetical protein